MAPGALLYMARFTPLGRTRKQTTAHGSANQRVRCAVAASTVSGAIAYQGWNTGASTVKATRASAP